MKYLIVLLISFLMFGCTKSIDQTEEEIFVIEETGLLGCWVHDVENQTENLEDTFLMVRCNQFGIFTSLEYRYSFTLKEGGKGTELIIGIVGSANSSMIWSSENDFLWIGFVEYEIIESTDDRLLIRRVE